MKKVLIVLAMVLVLGTGAMAADFSWTGYLTYVMGSGDDAVLSGTQILVEVEANKIAMMPDVWEWKYILTPGAGVKDVNSFSINMTPLQLSSIPAASVSNNVGWYGAKTAYSVQWSAGPAMKLSHGAPPTSGTFWYESSLAPSVLSVGRAQDGGQYNGQLPTPVVPEPMSILLGALGLGAVGGMRKLRAK